MNKNNESCQKCRFVQPQNMLAKPGGNDPGSQFFCRFNPPTVQMLPVQNQITAEVSFNIQTVNVPVLPDGWCGRFECAVEYGSLLQ